MTTCSYGREARKRPQGPDKGLALLHWKAGQEIPITPVSNQAEIIQSRSAGGGESERFRPAITLADVSSKDAPRLRRLLSARDLGLVNLGPPANLGRCHAFVSPDVEQNAPLSRSIPYRSL